MPKRDEPGLLLSGLDGSNPLGFLAAVGTLRTLTLAAPDAEWRMRWVTSQGAWRPEVQAENLVSQRDVIDLLYGALRRKSVPEFKFALDLNVKPEEYAETVQAARKCSSREDRRYADFMASFGCETHVSTNEKTIQDTAFRTMSGAGHQHFLGTMKQLVEETKTKHLEQSLFAEWGYQDEKLGMRWDPEEDRRYALRWDNPSGDTIRTMRGANRLAVEALPLFPTAPGSRRLETTGFSRSDREYILTWPIWKNLLCLDVIRSLLSLDEIQESQPDETHLHSRGVVQVYRSKRITVGKYRNFSHAHPA